MIRTKADMFNEWSLGLYDNERLDEYLSDYSTDHSDQVINDGGNGFNDKRTITSRLPEYMTVGIYVEISDGLALRHGTPAPGEPFVIKPTNSTNGEGVKFYKFGMVDNDILHHIDLSKRTGQSFIFTEYAEPHAYAKAVWPRSANSLRILSFHDGRNTHIIGAVQKWGTEHSRFTDNWSRGGVTTLVDVDTGTLLYTREDFTPVDKRAGKGSTRRAYKEYRFDYEVHPESGVQIYGTLLPFWEDCLTLIRDASRILYPDLVYCGWDLMITSHGPVIIEANPQPGVQLMQVHGGLLKDEAFKAFLKSYSIRGIE